MKTDIKKLPKSKVEITFELTAEEFLEHYGHAVEHLKGHVNVEGFRPGKAPAKMVEEKLKPEALLMEAGDHAVQHVYSEYIKDSKLEAVGHPEIQIKKIAKGSEFVFVATVTVLPNVELPDYKKIAAAVKGQDVLVTEQEVLDSLNYLQKTRAKMSLKNDIAQKGDFVQIKYQNKDINGGKEIDDQFVLGEAGFVKGFEDNIVGIKAGEEKTFTLAEKGEFKVKMVSVQKMDLPEVNDEFAKQLGAFDTLVALKSNIKEGLTAEKKEAEKQRRRAEILDKIAEKARFEMPEDMVEYEKERLLDDLKARISQVVKNMTFEQYLASVKKTEDEIKATYQKEAEKRLRGFLVLRELGKMEKIEVSDAEVEAELKGKTLRQAQGEVDMSQLREYTKGVLYNEKVFQSLELIN